MVRKGTVEGRSFSREVFRGNANRTDMQRPLDGHRKDKLTSGISLVFPAYNEEANIARSVSQALDILPLVCLEHEIIVVNDGSRDRTGEITDGMARRHPSVRPIHHPMNRGYGAAVKSGIHASRKELIFLCDSDLQFDLAEMPRMVEWIRDYDLVIGYRAKRADRLQRNINAQCWRLLMRLLFGLKVRDIDCAFKLFRRRIFDRVRLTSNGAMVSSEMLVQAQRCGFRIKELPVSHYPRTGGQQTGADPKVILKAFRDLIRFYRQMKLDRV
jgi:glycosyltransferase involved in cell wall biosynthesis